MQPVMDIGVAFTLKIYLIKKKTYFLQKILEFPDEICYNIKGASDQ